MKIVTMKGMGTMNNRFLMTIIMVLYVLVYPGCKSTQVSPPEKSDTDVTPLLEEIIKINTTMPHSINGAFRIEAFAKNSFKASAKLQYNVDAKKGKMTIVDSVFGSQISVVVRDNDTLYIYQPIGNTVLVFNFTRFPVSSFLPFDIDVEIIDDFLTGRIPIIKNYNSAKAIKQSNGESFILLENDQMHQTISMKQNVPDKIMFVSKENSKRYEIYFIKPTVTNTLLLYKGLRLVDVQSKTAFEITMQKYSINEPIPDDITDLKLPKNTKIVDYR